MSLNSLSFIVFFAILYLLLLFIDNIRLRKAVLLIASFVFYGISSLPFALLLAIYILVLFFLAKTNSKAALKIGVILSIALLGLFKYYNFFVDSFALSSLALKLLIPLGISFYCFRGIAYLVDIYREKYAAETDLLNFALYIAYFPEMISGPISRYQDLTPQFADNKQNLENLSAGIQMFVIGFLKKAVLADNLAVFVGAVFDYPEIYSSFSILLTVLAYAMEIYLDFSGYSDMSIGVSRMLGYDIRKNFDMPYLSHNVTEFWKRWHISLSSWLQEYVYYPLGGNRKGKLRQYLNLFLTMAIGGLWHGASWTFVVWGCLQGLALIVHKLFIATAKQQNRSSGLWGILLTFGFICLSWIPFRAASFAKMLALFVGLFSFRSGISFISSWALIVLAVVLFAYLYVIMGNKKDQTIIHAYYPLQDLRTLKGLTIFFALILIILCLGYTGGSPFIYAAF